MGIPSLLQNLRSIESFTSISKYAGTTVGIDAYSWLHKGASTCVASLVRNKETKRLKYHIFLILFYFSPYNENHL